MPKQSEHALPSILSRTKLEEGKESRFKRRNNDLVDRLNELDRQANILARLIKNFESDRILLVKEIVEIIAKIKTDLIENFTTLDQERGRRRWSGSSISSSSSHLSNISSELSIASNESCIFTEEEIAKINIDYKNQIESFIRSVKYKSISVQEMRSLGKEASDLLRMACLNFAKHARNGSAEKNAYREYAFKLADISILLNKQILERMRVEDDVELELEELNFNTLEIITEEDMERDEVLEEEQTLFYQIQQKEITEKEEQIRYNVQEQKITEYKDIYQYGCEIQRNLITAKENQLRIKLNEQHAAWYYHIYQEKQNIHCEASRKKEEAGRIEIWKNESFEREIFKCQGLEVTGRNELVCSEISTRKDQVASFNVHNKLLFVLKTERERLAEEKQRLQRAEVERQREVAEKERLEREEAARKAANSVPIPINKKRLG